MTANIVVGVSGGIAAYKAVEVVQEAITIKADLPSVVRFIKECMDANFIGDWNVYLLYNNVGFVYHNITAEGYIEVKFGRVVVTVYRTFDSVSFVCITCIICFICPGLAVHLDSSWDSVDN